MQITLDLPEDIAAQLRASRVDLSRAALESLAIEAYRSGDLSESQVRRLLGLDTRYEVHARKFTEKWLSSQTPPRSTT